MMSRSVVSAGAASNGYYKTEGYYAQESDEATQSSEWFGKQADAIGLSGSVDDKTFSDMLQGQTFLSGPDGLVHGRHMETGFSNRRPGEDITFSAPKSGSIAALVFGDKRLLKVHDDAVKEAMAYVEENIIQTRRKVNGETIKETGGKMIVGIHRHDTSRSLDPQTHSHAVIPSMIMNSGGEYTALLNDKILTHQKLISNIYRNAYARGAREIGYTTEREGIEGHVNLKEVAKDVQDHFSNRKKQIDAALDSKELPDTHKMRSLAALATRAAKQRDVDRGELLDHWKEGIKELGYDDKYINAFLDKMKDRGASYVPGQTKYDISSDHARVALGKAIAHLSERQTVYTKEEILSESLRFSNDKINIEQAQDAIENDLKSGNLLQARDRNSEDILYTDRESLLVEQKISTFIKATSRAGNLPNGKNGRSFDGSLKRRLAKTTMTDGQKEAIVTALTGKEQFVGINGYAGTGKTYMVSYIAKLAKEEGYAVQGLAPSSEAVGKLQEALPDSENITARLTRGRSKTPLQSRKTIIVVDEASMISNSQMVDLMEAAQRNKQARVVFVGDPKQLPSPQAGDPFRLLMKQGMRTATMSDIMRQREGQLRDAVYDAVAGDIKEAFDKIGSHIQQNADIGLAAANSYLSIDQKAREKAGIVTPSNRLRTEINQHVRTGLQQEGSIGSSDIRIGALTSLNMSNVEKAEHYSYSDGDIIIPNQSVGKAGLVKGQMYRVNVDPNNQLNMRVTDLNSGKTKEFDPSSGTKLARAITVYERVDRDFATGEQVRFKIQDKRSGIENGHEGVIQKIDDQQAVVKLRDGTTRNLDITSTAAAGMDYAYAMTNHGKQGDTVGKIIVAMSSNEYLSDQPAFYVGISRATDEAILLTDDPTRLSKRIEKATGERISALEAVELAKDEEREKLAEQAENDKTTKEQKDKTREDLTELDKAKEYESTKDNVIKFDPPDVAQPGNQDQKQAHPKSGLEEIRDIAAQIQREEKQAFDKEMSEKLQQMMQHNIEQKERGERER